jgi:Rrf2 family protein
MRLSAKVEYGCLAIIALARQPEGPPLQTRTICRDYGIPRDFLSHIMLRLKAAGLVSSIRGCHGGYRLSRDVGSISLSDVVSAIDGQDEALSEGSGRVSHTLISIRNQIRSTERAALEQTTMARLAQRESPGE